MTIVDDRVLEYIREHGHGSPKKMKDNGPIRYSRGYISERCKKLAEHGLLQPVGNGVYTITERGEKYLDEKIDTHVDQPDSVDVESEEEQATGLDETKESP